MHLRRSRAFFSDLGGLRCSKRQRLREARLWSVDDAPVEEVVVLKDFWAFMLGWRGFGVAWAAFRCMRRWVAEENG